MYRVLVSDALSSKGLELLQADPSLAVEVKTGLKPDALREIIGAYDALVVRSATQVDAALLAAAKKLRVVGRAGIGVDNVDLEAATRRGVVVMNTPSGNATTTAEHALALMFAIARHIPQATASMKAGKWEKKKFEGHEISSKTLGLLGLGNIGRIVADRALALKMNVLVYDPFRAPEEIRAFGAEHATLSELLARADFISVHTPLTDATRGLLGAEAFQQVKSSVYIINCARGGIVDEGALLAALDAGRVAGAALDVFVSEPTAPNDPLVLHPKVICTPHLGASTEEAQEKVAVEIAQQLSAFFGRGELANTVNVAPLSGEAATRLAPFVPVAAKLGELAAQLVGEVKSVEVELAGVLAGLPKEPVLSAALGGLLRASEDDGLNFVNAIRRAKDRGITLGVATRAECDFKGEVVLRVTGASGAVEVAGTAFAESGPRVVRVDRFQLEAIPEGHMLLVRNEDKPGVIGRIGTFLGERGVNIARLQVGQDAGSQQALSLWSLSSALQPEDVATLRGVPHVQVVQGLKF